MSPPCPCGAVFANPANHPMKIMVANLRSKWCAGFCPLGLEHDAWALGSTFIQIARGGELLFHEEKRQKCPQYADYRALPNVIQTALGEGSPRRPAIGAMWLRPAASICASLVHHAWGLTGSACGSTSVNEPNAFPCCRGITHWVASSQVHIYAAFPNADQASIPSSLLPQPPR